MLHLKQNFWGKRPGFDFGDILHIGVNLIFAAGLYILVVYWHLTLLALVLVILSKWRVMAVQPRFWLPNIKANMVDLIVGISTVSLINQAPNDWIGLFWALLYAGWLLIVKPQTDEVWVSIQAFWAQLLGLLVIYMIPSILKIPFIICVLAWLVAWSASRHFFNNYDEAHYRLLSLTWAFIVSQLVWVSLHWVQQYTVFNVHIAAMPLLISVVSASVGSIYHGYKKESLHKGLLLENSIFGVILVLVIFITSRWTARL
jgi:hypothetical protein